MLYYLLVSYILTIPYILSLINYYYIRYASFPPKAYQRRKGDLSINYRNTKASGIYVCVL